MTAHIEQIAFDQCTNGEQLTLTSQNFNLTVVEINVHGDLSTYSMPEVSSYCHWLNLADFFFEFAILIVMNVPLSILVYNEYTNVLIKTHLCLVSWKKFLIDHVFQVCAGFSVAQRQICLTYISTKVIPYRSANKVKKSSLHWSKLMSGQ